MSRILLISHVFSPAIDGGSRVIYQVGQQLESLGHSTLYLSSDASSTDDFTHKYQPISTQPNIIKLPVYTFFHRPLKFVSRLIPLLRPLAKGPIFKPIPFLKFLITYLRFSPNLIVAGPLPTTVVLYAHFFQRLGRLFGHSTTLLLNASFHPTDPDFHSKSLVDCLKRADYLWTLTNNETGYFHRHFGIPYSKMLNLGNGIPSSLLKSVPRKKVSSPITLTFIGSFSAHKGVLILIDAFEKISLSRSSQKFTFNLCLAGQKTLYFPQISSRLKLLPISLRSRIKLKTNFSNKDLPSILDNTTILISPSSQESFGLVLLEAMARGVPLVAANIPASRELISRSHAGLTFALHNSSALVKKVKKIITHPALYRHLSHNGLVYAQDHTWDKIVNKICQKLSL